MGYTTDPADPRLGHGIDTAKTPQHEVYLVLSEEERAKGFVRPLRRSYTHIGPPGPRYPLRDLTVEESEHYDSEGYVKYEEYPPTEHPLVGRFWTQAQLDAIGNGCGSSTRMGPALCETFARSPAFYGATFCVHFQKHLSVNEFTWDEDNQRVGS